MFSKYKYLIVILFFPPRFWSKNFFLIAPFPDHCLLVSVLLQTLRKRFLSLIENSSPLYLGELRYVTGLTADLLFTLFSSHYLDRKYTVYQFSFGSDEYSFYMYMYMYL